RQVSLGSGHGWLSYCVRKVISTFVNHAGQRHSDLTHPASSGKEGVGRSPTGDRETGKKLRWESGQTRFEWASRSGHSWAERDVVDMNSASGSTIRLQTWLDRLQNGDDKARQELVEHYYQRFLTLVRMRLPPGDRLRKQENSQDVLHDAFY